MIGNPQPIGFFDSGLGGLSVLIDAVAMLPNESFIYIGDSKNAPYGTKTLNEVKDLSFKNVQLLVDKGAKAVVVACNTATSASIRELRSTFSIPIIGMEPALKLAVDTHIKGDIAVMATPMTLSENKFQSLVEKVGKNHELVKIPAPDLVMAVEAGLLTEAELAPIFARYFGPNLEDTLDALVLGCTHYLFVKSALDAFFHHKVRLVDGNAGTIRFLIQQLTEMKALTPSLDKGTIELIMTGGEQSLAKAKALFETVKADGEVKSGQ